MRRICFPFPESPTEPLVHHPFYPPVDRLEMMKFVHRKNDPVNDIRDEQLGVGFQGILLLFICIMGKGNF